MEETSKKTELLQLNQHKAQGDYIIVVPVDIEESGITKRARQYEDRPTIGIVVSVGNQVTDIKEGDTIFFAMYANDSVTYDGVRYVIIRLEDIYCVAKE